MVFGDGAKEIHRLWLFIACQVPLTEIDNAFFCGLFPLFQGYRGLDGFPPFFIWNSNDRYLENSRVFENDILDFPGINVFSSTDEAALFSPLPLN
jgi:hypothetical protein